MKYVLAVLLLLLAACAPRPSVQAIPTTGDSAPTRSAVPQPGESTPGPRTEAPETSDSTAPTPQTEIGTPFLELRGTASFYDWHPGEAAAGPWLRRLLGKGWRGTELRVCAEHCRLVTVTDACGCPHQRIIDLDRDTFAAVCGDLAKGLCRVTVKSDG